MQKLIAFFLFYIYCLFCVQAQHRQYLHFTEEDGLPSNFVYKTFQDSKGYIWFATDKGVVKYNDNTFRTFNESDGLPVNDIYEMVEDRQNRLWLSGKGLLTYIYEDSVHIFKDKQTGETQNLDTRKLEVTAAKNLFIFTSSRKNYILIGDSIHKILDTPYITSIQPIFPKAIYYLNGKTSDNSYNLTAINYLSAMPINSSKDIYLHYRALEKEGFNIKKQLLTNEELGINRIIEGKILPIISDISGAIFFRDKGKLVSTDTLGNILPYDPFFEKISLSFIYEDREGNRWITTTDDGVYMLPVLAKNTLNYAILSGKVNDLVYAPKSASLFISSNQPDFYQLKKGKIHVINKREKYNSINTYDTKILLDDNENPILLGNQATYLHYNSQNQQVNSYALPYLTAPKDAFIDDLHNFYIASGGGVIVKDKEKDAKWHYLDSIRTYAIVKDKQSRLWLGRLDGLYLRENGKERHLGGLDSICKSSVKRLGIDAQQNIWVGTENNGVYAVLPNQKIHIISELAHHKTSDLFIDAKQQIWVGTEKGLIKIKMLSYQPFSYRIQTFSTANGLKSNIIDAVTVWKDTVFVANRKELAIFRDTDMADFISQKPFPIHIININVNGLNQPKKGNTSFSYTENNFLIQYAGLSYKSCGKITYQYRLLGISDLWQETANNEKEFSRLPPGDYTFEVKAIGIDGTISEKPATYSFTIRPPFWNTWVFRFSLLFLCFAAIALYINWQKRKTKTEIQTNQKFAQLEMQALQSQMNPHFVFNALMAIQGFLLSHEIDKSNNYLVKFSRLIRMILDSTRSKYIMVAKEIQLIKDYVALEQMRFEDKFESVFTIAEDLDTNAEIPVMFIQPFVENAINHGLLHKSEKGFLQIHFYQDEANLCVLIEDNGVGRKKAKEIKQRSTKSYRSQATFILEDRQKLFRISENMNIKIEIEDLENEGGTKVFIQLPFRD